MNRLYIFVLGKLAANALALRWHSTWSTILLFRWSLGSWLDEICKQLLSEFWVSNFLDLVIIGAIFGAELVLLLLNGQLSLTIESLISLWRWELQVEVSLASKNDLFIIGRICLGKLFWYVSTDRLWVEVLLGSDAAWSVLRKRLSTNVIFSFTFSLALTVRP